MADQALEPIATAIGQTWVVEVVEVLRSEERDISGAWPGTLREARARVLAKLRVQLDLAVIDQLARVAYAAARRGWRDVSGPDLDP